MDAAKMGYTSKKSTPAAQGPRHLTQLQTYTNGKSAKKNAVIMLTDNAIHSKKRQAKTHVHKNSRRSYQSKRSSADQNSRPLYAEKPSDRRSTSTQNRRGPPKPDSAQAHTRPQGEGLGLAYNPQSRQIFNSLYLLQ